MGWNRPFPVLLTSLILILVFAGLPLIGALTAGVIAGALGCRLDEGSIHPCPFLGADIGETLYEFFVLGWLSLMTMPAGFLFLLMWLFAAIVVIVRRRRAARSASRLTN